jgi:hypothetical protein
MASLYITRVISVRRRRMLLLLCLYIFCFSEFFIPVYIWLWDADCDQWSSLPSADIRHRGRGKGNIGLAPEPLWALWKGGKSSNLAGVELKLPRLQSHGIKVVDFQFAVLIHWLEYEKRNGLLAVKCRFNTCSYFFFKLRLPSGGVEIFRNRPGWPWGLPNLLYNGSRLFTGGKEAGAWCWPPTFI